MISGDIIQVYMVGGDVTIPERRHSARSVNIEPGQIRSECYTNDVNDDGEINPFSAAGIEFSFEI